MHHHSRNFMLCSQLFTFTTSQLIIIIYKHNIDNTELLLLVVLIILIKAVDYTMCEYISSQYQTICNIVLLINTIKIH